MINYEESSLNNQFNIDFLLKYVREIITLFLVATFYFLNRSKPLHRDLFKIIMFLLLMAMIFYIGVGALELLFSRIMLPVSFTFSLMVMFFLLAFFPRRSHFFSPFILVWCMKLVVVQSQRLLFPDCGSGLAFGC